MNKIEEFKSYRTKMNGKILSSDNLVIKRLFSLDTNVYQPGELNSTTKEMLGLACSLVLRCDDCMKYHLGKCYHEKMSDKALHEILSIATVIGGTIVIPHLRRAFEYWDELKDKDV